MAEPEHEELVESEEEDQEVENVVETVDELQIKDEVDIPEKISNAAAASRKKRLKKIKEEMKTNIKLTDLTDAIVTKPAPKKRTTVKEVKEALEKEQREKEELKQILLNMRAEMDRQTKEREQEKEMKKAKKLAKAAKTIVTETPQKSARQLELEKSMALYRQKILGIH